MSIPSGLLSDHRKSAVLSGGRTTLQLTPGTGICKPTPASGAILTDGDGRCRSCPGHSHSTPRLPCGTDFCDCTFALRAFPHAGQQFRFPARTFDVIVLTGQFYVPAGSPGVRNCAASVRYLHTVYEREKSHYFSRNKS